MQTHTSQLLHAHKHTRCKHTQLNYFNNKHTRCKHTQLNYFNNKHTRCKHTSQLLLAQKEPAYVPPPKPVGNVSNSAARPHVPNNKWYEEVVMMPVYNGNVQELEKIFKDGMSIYVLHVYVYTFIYIYMYIYVFGVLAFAYRHIINHLNKLANDRNIISVAFCLSNIFCDFRGKPREDQLLWRERMERSSMGVRIPYLCVGILIIYKQITT